MALLAHYFHLKPWDVERLTEAQVQMYLSQVNHIRLMDHMPHLSYAYSKYSDEAIEKMIAESGRPADPESLRSRGWRLFIRQYQTDSEEAEQQAAAEALPLSQAAAAAFVRMVETGELTRSYPLGSLWWRLKVLPIWPRLLATADQAAESPQ
jgi:hypothetical protein